MPSSEHLERLAGALDVEVERLSEGTTWLSSAARRALKEASTTARRTFSRPCRYRPPRDRDMMLHVKKAMVRHAAQTRTLPSYVARRRDADSKHAVAGGHASRLVHRSDHRLVLLAMEAAVVRVAPQLVGFRCHPVVNPKTRESVGDCEVLGYAIVLDGLRCLFIPQVGVACRKATWVLDFLLGVVDERGVLHWIDFEIDGDGHDYSGDLNRTADIDMPTVRLPQSIILRGDTVQVLVERIRAVIPSLRRAA